MKCHLSLRLELYICKFYEVEEELVWNNLHNDVIGFLETCDRCQLYSIISQRMQRILRSVCFLLQLDPGLHPTHPFIFYYNCIMDYNVYTKFAFCY